MQLLFLLLGHSDGLLLVPLPGGIHRNELALPILQILLLGLFTLLHDLPLPLHDEHLLALVHLLEGFSVLERGVLDLPRVVKLDQVERLEYVVHLVLVHFADGVVAGALFSDF